MVASSDPLQTIWDGLLSRNPDQIRSIYNSLPPNDQIAILKHLQRMATEPGWLPAQRQSAQSALDALSSSNNGNNSIE